MVKGGTCVAKRGACMVKWGVCGEGACVVKGACMARGVHSSWHAWQGVCTTGGHTWQGGHAWQGACMAVGACMVGCAWQQEHVWQGVCMVGHAWQGGICGWGCASQRGCMAGETATAVDGMHPTGMHSC